MLEFWNLELWNANLSNGLYMVYPTIYDIEILELGTVGTQI